MNRRKPSDERKTEAADGLSAAPTVRRFRSNVEKGPRAGETWVSAADHCAIGHHELNDLILADPTVSRFHCEITIDERGARVRDLDSRNGTVVDGVRVGEGWLRDGSLLGLGRAVLRFELSPEQNRLPLSEHTRFGGLVGRLVAMRTSFALMERAAATDFTVLLEGETGTGKGEAAAAIDAASTRREGPLLVVDCAALPEQLLESELFGHERGAFTGADARRIGVFEEASGGTIFLDEIGEMPAELQPKLLRVLENRTIRRVGTNAHRPVDVRVIAATHRDLRAEVNAGRFRHDLYFRMAVVKIPLPPLRARPDDIPLLVDKILGGTGFDDATLAPLRAPAFLAGLSSAAWPGNVRELRNHLERCLVFRDSSSTSPAAAAADEDDAPIAVDARRPYAEARQRALDSFEQSYVKSLLRLHDGNVSRAAEAAGITRVHLHRLLRRHR